MRQPDPKAPKGDFAERLRVWRRLNRIKQEWLAEKLGVSQAAISRWEAGTDRPRRAHMGKLLDIIESTLSGPLAIERQFISSQSGISSLLRYDGMRLLAVSKGFRTLWPDFSELVGHELIDDLVDEAAEALVNPDFRDGTQSGAIALISGVSQRHTAIGLDQQVRHRWHACFRKQGPLLMVQMVYEPCDPMEPTGIDLVVNLDTMSETA